MVSRTENNSDKDNLTITQSRDYSSLLFDSFEDDQLLGLDWIGNYVLLLVY
jgi:hypothetical protein